jgi:hypothetical protein
MDLTFDKAVYRPASAARGFLRIGYMPLFDLHFMSRRACERSDELPLNLLAPFVIAETSGEQLHRYSFPCTSTSPRSGLYT